MALAGETAGTVTALLRRFLTFIFGEKNVPDTVSHETESEIADLRRSTHTGRPLGGAEFIASLEQRTLRRLAPRKGGRPRQPLGENRQGTFTLGR